MKSCPSDQLKNRKVFFHRYAYNRNGPCSVIPTGACLTLWKGLNRASGKTMPSQKTRKLITANKGNPKQVLPPQLRNLQDATCVERSICRGYPQSADTRVAADGAIMNKAVSPMWPKRAPKTKKGLSQFVKNIWHPHRHTQCFGREEVGGQHRRVPDSGPCRSFEVDVGWAWGGLGISLL